MRIVGMNKKFERRAKELVDAHWNYIENLLRVHGEKEDVIKKIGFHYKTSGIHFYKHAIEDLQETTNKYEDFKDAVNRIYKEMKKEDLK